MNNHGNSNDPSQQKQQQQQQQPARPKATPMYAKLLAESQARLALQQQQQQSVPTNSAAAPSSSISITSLSSSSSPMGKNLVDVPNNNNIIPAPRQPLPQKQESNISLTQEPPLKKNHQHQQQQFPHQSRLQQDSSIATRNLAVIAPSLSSTSSTMTMSTTTRSIETIKSTSQKALVTSASTSSASTSVTPTSLLHTASMNSSNTNTNTATTTTLKSPNSRPSDSFRFTPGNPNVITEKKTIVVAAATSTTANNKSNGDINNNNPQPRSSSFSSSSTMNSSHEHFRKMATNQNANEPRASSADHHLKKEVFMKKRLVTNRIASRIGKTLVDPSSLRSLFSSATTTTKTTNNQNRQSDNDNENHNNNNAKVDDNFNKHLHLPQTAPDMCDYAFSQPAKLFIDYVIREHRLNTDPLNNRKIGFGLKQNQTTEPSFSSFDEINNDNNNMNRTSSNLTLCLPHSIDISCITFLDDLVEPDHRSFDENDKFSAYGRSGASMAVGGGTTSSKGNNKKNAGGDGNDHADDGDDDDVDSDGGNNDVNDKKPSRLVQRRCRILANCKNTEDKTRLQKEDANEREKRSLNFVFGDQSLTKNAAATSDCDRLKRVFDATDNRLRDEIRFRRQTKENKGSRKTFVTCFDVWEKHPKILFDHHGPESAFERVLVTVLEFESIYPPEIFFDKDFGFPKQQQQNQQQNQQQTTANAFSSPPPLHPNTNNKNNNNNASFSSSSSSASSSPLAFPPTTRKTIMFSDGFEASVFLLHLQQLDRAFHVRYSGGFYESVEEWRREQKMHQKSNSSIGADNRRRRERNTDEEETNNDNQNDDQVKDNSNNKINNSLNQNTDASSSFTEFSNPNSVEFRVAHQLASSSSSSSSLTLNHSRPLVKLIMFNSFSASFPVISHYMLRQQNYNEYINIRRSLEKFQRRQARQELIKNEMIREVIKERKMREENLSRARMMRSDDNDNDGKQNNNNNNSHNNNNNNIIDKNELNGGTSITNMNKHDFDNMTRRYNDLGQTNIITSSPLSSSSSSFSFFSEEEKFRYLRGDELEQLDHDARNHVLAEEFEEFNKMKEFERTFIAPREHLYATDREFFVEFFISVNMIKEEERFKYLPVAGNNSIRKINDFYFGNEGGKKQYGAEVVCNRVVDFMNSNIEVRSYAEALRKADEAQQNLIARGNSSSSSSVPNSAVASVAPNRSAVMTDSQPSKPPCTFSHHHHHHNQQQGSSSGSLLLRPQQQLITTRNDEVLNSHMSSKGLSTLHAEATLLRMDSNNNNIDQQHPPVNFGYPHEDLSFTGNSFSSFFVELRYLMRLHFPTMTCHYFPKIVKELVKYIERELLQPFDDIEELQKHLAAGEDPRYARRRTPYFFCILDRDVELWTREIREKFGGDALSHPPARIDQPALAYVQLKAFRSQLAALNNAETAVEQTQSNFWRQNLETLTSVFYEKFDIVYALKGMKALRPMHSLLKWLDYHRHIQCQAEGAAWVGPGSSASLAAANHQPRVVPGQHHHHHQGLEAYRLITQLINTSRKDEQTVQRLTNQILMLPPFSPLLMNNRNAASSSSSHLHHHHHQQQILPFAPTSGTYWETVERFSAVIIGKMKYHGIPINYNLIRQTDEMCRKHVVKITNDINSYLRKPVAVPLSRFDELPTAATGFMKSKQKQQQQQQQSSSTSASTFRSTNPTDGVCAWLIPSELNRVEFKKEITNEMIRKGLIDEKQVTESNRKNWCLARPCDFFNEGGFNPLSWSDVALVMYAYYGYEEKIKAQLASERTQFLPTTFVTSTGKLGTGKEVLQYMMKKWPEFEFPQLLTRYRGISKLRETYFFGLFGCALPCDGWLIRHDNATDDHLEDVCWELDDLVSDALFITSGEENSNNNNNNNNHAKKKNNNIAAAASVKYDDMEIIDDELNAAIGQDGKPTKEARRRERENRRMVEENISMMNKLEEQQRRNHNQHQQQNQNHRLHQVGFIPALSQLSGRTNVDFGILGESEQRLREEEKQRRIDMFKFTQQTENERTSLMNNNNNKSNKNDDDDNNNGAAVQHHEPSQFYHRFIQNNNHLLLPQHHYQQQEKLDSNKLNSNNENDDNDDDRALAALLTQQIVGAEVLMNDRQEDAISSSFTNMHLPPSSSSSSSSSSTLTPAASSLLPNPRRRKAIRTLHANWILDGTDTGRMACDEPNMQNVPRISDAEADIDRVYHTACRAALLPLRDDHLIVTFDYNQVELRLLAAMSGDSNLIATLQLDDAVQSDVHKRMAARMFYQSEQHVHKVTADERRRAKSLVFGMTYGMGKEALARKIGCDTQQARNIMSQFDRAFPGVKEYQEAVVKSSKLTSRVHTLNGARFRPTEYNNNSGYSDCGRMERAAFNSAVQGSAADVIKKAMVWIEKFLPTLMQQYYHPGENALRAVNATMKSYKMKEESCKRAVAELEKKKNQRQQQESQSNHAQHHHEQQRREREGVDVAENGETNKKNTNNDNTEHQNLIKMAKEAYTKRQTLKTLSVSADSLSQFTRMKHLEKSNQQQQQNQQQDSAASPSSSTSTTSTTTTLPSESARNDARTIRGDDCFLLMQVHDELVFSIRRSKLIGYARAIKWIMENSSTLPNKVALPVTVNVGATYGTLHKLEIEQSMTISPSGSSFHHQEDQRHQRQNNNSNNNNSASNMVDLLGLDHDAHNWDSPLQRLTTSELVQQVYRVAAQNRETFRETRNKNIMK